MDVESRRIVCKVCLSQVARYICPRCNISYCCLECYKKHSSTCTEAFYRDQATQQLKTTYADLEQKNKLLETLQRVQQQQEQDERQQDKLLRRLAQEEASQLPQSAAGCVITAAGPNLGHELEDEDDTSDDDDNSDSESCTEDDGDDDDASDQDDDDDSRPALPDDMTSSPGVGASGPVASTSAGQSGRRSHREPCKLSKATLSKLIKKIKKHGLDSVEIDESDLAPEELQAFHRAVTAGQLQHLVRAWNPWWLSQEAREITLSTAGQKLVQETITNATGDAAASDRTSGRNKSGRGLSSSATSGDHTVLPAASDQPLQPISALTRISPSPVLRFQVVQLLYSYCLLQRRYNGDAAGNDNAAEAAQNLFLLVPGLVPAKPGPSIQKQSTQLKASTVTPGSSQEHQSRPTAVEAMQEQEVRRSSAAAVTIPQTVSEAVLSCLEAACTPPIGDVASRTFAVPILADVITILDAGNAAVVLALTDLKRIVDRAGQQARSPHFSGLRKEPQAVDDDSSTPRCAATFQQLKEVRVRGVNAGNRQASTAQGVTSVSTVSGPPRGKAPATADNHKSAAVVRSTSSISKKFEAVSRKLWFMMCLANDAQYSEHMCDLLIPAMTEEFRKHGQTLQA